MSDAGQYVVLWRQSAAAPWWVQPLVYPYGQARDLANHLTATSGGTAIAHLVDLSDAPDEVSSD